MHRRYRGRSAGSLDWIAAGNRFSPPAGQARLKVPDEIAVIGVHHAELLCELCDPPL